MQVPTQSIDQPGAFDDQRFAVVNEQPHVAFRAVKASGGQTRLT